MASLFPRGNKGPYRIQFGPAVARETIYLGQVPRRFAEEFCRGVERLVQCREVSLPMDGTTLQWLSDLRPKWRQKLAAKGLTEDLPVATVGELGRAVIAKSHERKLAPKTIAKHREAVELLERHFGAERMLQSITEEDAESFRTWLRVSSRQIGEGDLALTTVTQKCKLAQQFFKTAVRKRWIRESPFAGMRGWVTDSPDRQVYVDPATTEELIAKADPELALVIALARYGGLRCTTEVLALRWEGVDWEGNWLDVWSQKNQRYAHKAWRRVPLYADLLPHLLAAAERAPEGAEYVVATGRDISDTAWRNRLERCAKRAGVAAWSSLWNSLRGSKATDLLDAGFPPHVVAEWQNDSVQTLLRYYARVKSDHHARAIGLSSQVAKEQHSRATAAATATSKSPVSAEPA